MSIAEKIGLLIALVYGMTLAAVMAVLLRGVVDTLEELAEWARIFHDRAEKREKRPYGMILIHDTDDEPEAV